MEKTDAELVELSKQNPEAFGFLMERYEDPLFRYIRRIGQLSKEDSKDVLQEVFIKIYQKLNEYEESLKFSSWVYRIAHNHVIDTFRRANARPKTDAIEDEAWERLMSASVRIDTEMFHKECLQKVREVIAELPMKYREVLVLRFLEEKEYEEIMDILKKPKGSVATLIARGKSMLMERLRAQGINCLE